MDFTDKPIRCLVANGAIFDVQESLAYTGMNLLDQDFEPLTRLFKEVLGDEAEKVVISGRVPDSPCLLTYSESTVSKVLCAIASGQGCIQGFTIGAHENLGS